MDLRGFWKPEKKDKPPKKDRAKKQKKPRINHAPPVAKGKRHKDYRKDAAFYRSDEWLRLRYLALKTHGAKCQCCGATATDGETICVDHIIPRRIAPQLSLDLGNLQVLCRSCNVGKAAWDQTDWRPNGAMDCDALAHMQSIAKEG